MTDEQVEQIISERLQGASVRKIAKSLRLSIDDVNTTLDGLAEEITPRFKLRSIAVDLARLDEHFAVFHKKALDGDVNSGELCLKIAARRAAILGTDAPQQTRIDVLALQGLVAKPQSTVDRIQAALAQLKITGPPAATSEHSEVAANANGSLIVPRGELDAPLSPRGS